MIEIDLYKLKKVEKTVRVKAHQTKHGYVKAHDRKVKGASEDKDTLSIFKASLKDMSTDELKSQINIVEDEYPEVHKGLKNWYDNKSMMAFDGEISAVFNMGSENSRSDDIPVLDAKTIEGYKKIYSVTQEYLSRTDPDGNITITRGLGPRSYQEYKELSPGEDIKIRQYNVSSWTTDDDMATEFAERDEDGGIIIGAYISTDRVFMHPDCASEISDDYDESEIIIMGSEIKASIGESFPPENEEDDEYE